MAVLKHIKSRNANYRGVLEYLLFQHDAENGKMILDEQGRKILRDEFYMDGLNCKPMAFDTECLKTNAGYHKNKKRTDIKNHHYIISFDPKDAADCGLTGQKAQELSLELARKVFPGYQALVVTHTDGDSHSGNIHTHIVINSVRKYDAPREDYMTQPGDHKAGGKHRSTNKFLMYFKKEIMTMCEQEGLHQIDLLSPAREKVPEAEYRAKIRGQKKLDQVNKKIKAAGIKPAATVFQTQKDDIRNAVAECSRSAGNFEEFQNLLLENYNISVISQRGRYRYLHPDRDRRITEKSLGTDYGREHLEEIFRRNAKTLLRGNRASAEHSAETDYHKDPTAIFFYRTQLRLVIDLQENVKAMQSEAYAHKVKITNLQQMANTLIYIQEHGYDAREDLAAVTADAQKKVAEAQDRINDLNAEMKVLNSQIHYTGQYFASKKVYAEFLMSRNKKKFRQEHSSSVKAYEESRDWLKNFYPDGKILSLKSLKLRKNELQEVISREKEIRESFSNKSRELETVSLNVDAILDHRILKTERAVEKPPARTTQTKKGTKKSYDTIRI